MFVVSIKYTHRGRSEGAGQPGVDRGEAGGAVQEVCRSAGGEQETAAKVQAGPEIEPELIL